MTASMWDELTNEERTWKEKCRRFADEVIRQHYRRCDEDNCFPMEVHIAAHDWGLMNASFPEELGGLGMSHRAMAIGGEELGAVCAPTAFTMGFNHGSLQPVLHAGTSEQKQFFVRDLLSRREYASLCMTEPDVSGSDLFSIQTTARRNDRGWTLNGTKCMTGVGTESSVFFVFADTEMRGKRCGLSIFAVPRGEGVSVSPNIDKLGFRCVTTPTITFSDVQVPHEYLIGGVGQAEIILLRTLDFMRFGGVSVILGLVVGGLRDILPWLEHRRTAQGELLVNKSHIQLGLGRIYSELQTIRLLLWRAAALIDAGLPCGAETSIAKYKASTLALEATQEFVQLQGWRGLDAEYPAQKRLRDARATAIFEGTNEIMLLHAFRDFRRQARAGGDL